jgi:hypothetical protein
MRGISTIFGTCVGVLALSACSLVVDSGSYTGGTSVDITPPEQLLQQHADRIEEWCRCYHGIWNFTSAAQCQEALTPAAEYGACLRDAYVDNLDAVGNAFTCQLDHARTLAECEGDAACLPGQFNQCLFDYQQVVYVSEACFPAGYQPYFSAQVQCAFDHVVGTPLGGCSSAGVLTGSTFVGYTVGSGDNFNVTGSTCFTNVGAADGFVRWAPQGTGPVIIDTLGTTFDTALYVIAACDSTTDIACNDDITFPGVVQSRLEIDNHAENDDVVVVVDGFAAPDFGAYRLNITTLWCADDVAVPLDISTMLGPAVFSGSTSGNASRFDPAIAGCAQSTGVPDAVLAWQAPLGGTYAIDTEGSNFDTVLYVRLSCDGALEYVCNDDAASFAPQSRVLVSLMAHETVLIVVDGADDLGTADGGVADGGVGGGAVGNYQVNITKID